MKMNTSINIHGITKITIERERSPSDAGCDSYNLTDINLTDRKGNVTRLAVFSDEFVDIEEIIDITEPAPQHLKMETESLEYEKAARMDDLIPETPPFLNEQNG